MVRNRTRLLKGCNPNNLHVIPTASVNPGAVIVTIPPQIPVENIISITPTNQVNRKNFYNYKKNKKKRNRPPRKSNARFATRTILPHNDYAWCNPNKETSVVVPVTDISQSADLPQSTDLTQNEDLTQSAQNNNQPDKENANVENAPETTPEDFCFEEVEVASSEGESKHIPVGFRKTKLCYLSYKKNYFFKPKFYKLCAQRTVVNCLNVEDNVSVDIDIVSEAEYDDEPDNAELDDSSERLGKIVEIEEESGNDFDNKMADEMPNDTKDHMEEEPMKDLDDHISEEEVIEEYENQREDSGSDIEILSEYESPKDVKNDTETADSAKNAECQKEKEKVADIEVLESSLRTYKTCIKANDGFNQGKSLIQSKLNSWMSHLIGLEYLIEIQNENGGSVMKYYCVLCCEDLKVGELPEVPVINHINGHKHVMKYLEKHFSSCGYKCGEKSGSDFLFLQKLCEKINENLGYYFMCFTSEDYFTENKEQIKNVILSSYHPNEDDFKLNKEVLQKTVESDLLLDVTCVLEDCIEKIAPKEVAITFEIESKKDNKEKLNSKAVSDSAKNVKAKSSVSEERSAKSKKQSALDGRHKGNNPVSAYLRLRFAANKKLPTHVKKPSNKSKEAVKETTEEKSVKEIKSVESISDGETIKSNKIIEAKQPEIIDITSDEITEITTSDHSTNTKESDQVVKVEESNQVEESEQVLDVEESDQMVEGEDSDQAVESTEALGVLESHEAVSDTAQSDTREKAYKLKQKFLLKTSLHSKHCRKRILDKESSRLRLATKSSVKDQFVSEVLNKTSAKNKTVVRSQDDDASKNILPVKHEHRHVKVVTSSTHKRTPVYKVIAVPSQKASAEVSELSLTKYSSSHHRVVHKKVVENLSKDKVITIKDSSSNWKPMKSSASPVNSITASDKSHVLRSPARRQSRSPVKRSIRERSKSPVGRIRSPLRLPVRKAPLRSPVRRYSRSPVRQRSRSPVRRKSRSPVRRKSRSPARRKSRSPVRRKSRSPIRRRSRSPYRRHSRSPIRRKSRSPRFHVSRSPVRRKSRSPFSRSPLRRLSRSPLRHRSRSPLRQRSRSPLRRYSRSPNRHRSRSPRRRHSRSPVRRLRDSPTAYENLHKIHSHNAGHFSSSREHKIPNDQFSQKRYDFHKRVDSRESELTKFGSSSKMLSPPRSMSHIFPSSSARGISDLDPVSDEDESLYFSDKHQRVDDDTPTTTKSMLSKLLKKFSAADSNANDPAVNKLMQFMEAHSAEIEELVGSQSTKSSKVNVPKGETNMQEQNLLLQQILLSNIIGNMQGPVPSVISNLSNLLQAPRFTQPPFMQEQVLPGFRPPLTNVPPPQPLQPVLPPQTIQPRFFPPNINVPPPQIFQPINQPRPDFPPKPKVPPELMFKDLKATVNKLFGANENVKQDKKKLQMPGYVSEPDPEKWDLNHPDTRKFNAAANQKNIIHSPRKNINFSSIPESSISREKISAFNSNSNSGQFMGGSSVNRQRIPGLSVPPPDAKVSFCDVPRASSKGNLFPVLGSGAQMNPSFNSSSSRSSSVSDVKVSLAQRLASVLVKVGMIDVPAPLLQEMLMKIGAFSSSPRQNISESEILSILKRLGYL